MNSTIRIRRMLMSISWVTKRVFNINIEYMRPRHHQIFLQQHFKRKPVKGAEIGVWKGVNAKWYFKVLRIKKLYLIDPYEAYDDGSSDKNYKNLLKAKNKVLKMFGSDKRVKLIFKDSISGAKQIPDNSLDFAYIDGDHSYEFVIKDIRTYYRKVKKGGVISGDDITWKGVSKAVFEFCCEKKISAVIKGKDWIIVK